MEHKLTLEQKAALKEAAEKATPGPWDCADYRPHGGDYFYVRTKGHDLVAEMVMANGYEPMDFEANGNFIALANPATILALLAENEKLREALTQIKTFSLADPRNAECTAIEMQEIAITALEHTP